MDTLSLQIHASLHQYIDSLAQKGLALSDERSTMRLLELQGRTQIKEYIKAIDYLVDKLRPLSRLPTEHVNKALGDYLQELYVVSHDAYYAYAMDANSVLHGVTRDLKQIHSGDITPDDVIRVDHHYPRSFVPLIIKTRTEHEQEYNDIHAA